MGDGRIERRHWMAVLAKAPPAALEDFLAGLRPKPAYQRLRGPEIGLVMVRGRAGGDGVCFNFGEMTVTRCSVQLEEGGIGHGYVAGRAPRHAELAALYDALLQGDEAHDHLAARLIAPLERDHAERKRQAACRAAATKVDFFTMVRGGD